MSGSVSPAVTAFQRRGRRAKTSPIPPCCSSTMSWVESAPASIPHTSEATFNPAFAVLSGGTDRAHRPDRQSPGVWADASIGTRPPAGTRFGCLKNSDSPATQGHSRRVCACAISSAVSSRRTLPGTRASSVCRGECMPPVTRAPAAMSRRHRSGNRSSRSRPCRRGHCCRSSPCGRCAMTHRHALAEHDGHAPSTWKAQLSCMFDRGPTVIGALSAHSTAP